MKNPIVALASLGVLLSAAAQAGTITGSLWKLPDLATYTAGPGSIPVTTPDVVFDAPTPLGFSFTGTVGGWLGTGGAGGIVENTPGTLGSPMSDSVIGTLVNFEGCITISSGDLMEFTHDDGIYFSINGVDQGFLSGPTSPLFESIAYAGPSGTFPFQLVYTENHSGPAVLTSNLELTRCPDGGSTLGLIAGALGTLGMVSRRLRK